MSEGSLSAKRAIVTGATSGIGRAAAERFLAEGARVVVAGRAEGPLAELERDGAAPCRVDLTSADDRRRLIESGVELLGGLDVLVNAAGVLEPGTIETSDLAAFDRTMDLNVRALYELSHLAVPHLVRSRGNIVNVSSVAGTRSFPGVHAYCVSKAAVDQITRCAALELAEHGVRVNAVNPGVVVTEIHKRGGMSDEAYAEFLERSRATHPIGRVGRPDEVADLIAFLAADRAGWITGGTFAIDGGRAATCAR